MSRELLQQALDALDGHADPDDWGLKDALRAALAQPEPEPVALMALHDINELMHCNGMSVFVENPRIYPPYCEGEPLVGFVPLYATPPAAPIDGFGGNLDEAFERAPAVREPQEHIGWCRYVTAHEKATRLVLCDSDAPGAFRVYRGIGGGGK